MKLRLPQALLAALLAAAAPAYSVTIESLLGWDVAAIQTEIGQSGGSSVQKTVGETTYTFTLTGDLLAVTNLDRDTVRFQMDVNALKGVTSTSPAKVFYVVASKPNTSTVFQWGLNVLANAQGTPVFTGNANNGGTAGSWTNGGTPNVSKLLDDGVVTAKLSAPAGTTLANGTSNASSSTAANTVYWSDGLRYGDGTNLQNIVFNTQYVDSVYYNVENGYNADAATIRVSNSSGTWNRAYSTVLNATAGDLAAPATAVDATLVMAGTVNITSDNISGVNSNCGDIIVGGSGQLFQNTGTLNRNVYIGTTTVAGDNAGSAIVLNAGTFANVSLIEDASIYVMYSSSSAGGYITNLDLGGHNLTKKGAGTLWVNANPLSNTEGSAIDIQGGMLVLKAANSAKTDTVLSGLTMAAGTTVALQTGSDTASSLTTGRLTLNGGTAILQSGHSNNHASGFIINGVTSNASTILELQATQASAGKAAYVVFKNDGEVNGGLTGTLRLKQTNNSGDSRKFLVIVEDKDVLANAVVDFNQVARANGYGVLAVGSSATDASTEVSVKGLTGGTTTGPSRVVSYTSGYEVSANTAVASQGGHTLLITADGEDSYTFNGDMGDTLNVKMTGTGSQTLKNIGANAVADAGAGHLTISNAVGNNTVLRVGGGQLTVNGTLGTNVTLVSDGGWTLNNSSHKYEYSYDIADHVDGTNASTLLDSASYAFVASGDGENARCSTLDAANFHHATLILNSDTPAGTTAAGAYVNAGSTWGSDVQKLVMDGANLISLSGQTNTVSQNIELKGNTAFRAYEDPASGGDNRAHATMILTGELSGTGNIIQRDGGTLVLNFSASTGWTGGLVTQNCGNNAGVLEIESSMRASSVTLNGGSVLRIGKANTGVTLTTGAFTTTEATQNIELGNGAAWNINGRMTLNNNVATTVNIGTIGSSFNGTTRDGDYGSVTVTGLTMAINDNKHSTLNIGANVALNIKGEGSTNINANNNAYATAPLYLSNWQSNSITNIYGTLNALNCQYISVVEPGDSSNTMELNVMEGGVLNMKGLILQYRQNTGTDQAYAHVKLKDGSMLNIGSEGIQKYAIGGGGARQDVCKLYIHMGEGVTIGNLNGADGWTAGYDFTGDASFNNTTINTQNYVAKTDGSAGAVDATDTTGGTITLTGNVAGSVTKAGAGKLVISSGTTGSDTFTATVEKGTLEIGADATVAAGGKTTVASGATLDVQGALTLHTELANSGTVTATGSNATIAFANDTLLSGNGNTAFGSAQAGSATVTKRGTGELTLTDGIGAGNTLLFEAGTLSGGMTSGTLSFASLVGQDNLSLTSIAVGGSKLTLSDVGIDLGSLDLTDEAAGTFNLITYTDASKFQLGSNMLVNGNSVDGNGWFYITDGTGAAIGKAQLVATETALQLIVDHDVEINTLVWGTQDGTWVGAGHDGWQDGATYTDGSVVIFSGEGTAANAPLEISLSGDIAPSTIQVSGYYTFQSDTTTAGHLAGIAKLTVGSVNTSEVDGEEVTTPVATVLTLATDNSDWTGDATIMDGAELIATNTNALGAAQVSIEQGGTLTLSSAEGETGIFDLTQTVSGAGSLQVKDYAHVKLGNTSITGLTTVSDHAHVEANVAGALGDVTLKDSAVLTLGDDAAVGGTINFSTGGTLKYADGVTADLSGSITGDTVTVDVGSNTVTWAKTPGTTLVSGSADTTGTLILDNRETQPVDELVVAGGKVKIGHAKALKNTIISNGTANINTISTNITLNGGTLEFTNGYNSDGNGMAASVLARWTYMISGTVTADLASGQSAHITMGTETGYNDGDGIGFANENALTYLATNNGGTLYIDADITGFGSVNAVNRKFNIAKSTGAVDGVEVVINGQLGNNGANDKDSCRITIDKLGAGTLKIAGANYTPQLTIEEGTVIAAHAQALGKERNLANVVTVGTGDATAALDLQVGNTTAISQLLGNANGVIKSTAATAQTLKVGSATNGVQASEYHGKIASNVNLEVAANTVTLDGNLSEFNGNVKVSGGTLNISTSVGDTVSVGTLEMAQNTSLNIAEGKTVSTAHLTNNDNILKGLGGVGTLEYTGTDVVQIGTTATIGTINGNVHVTRAGWLQFTNSMHLNDDGVSIAGKFASDVMLQVSTGASVTVADTGEVDVKGSLYLGHTDNSDTNWGKLNVNGTLNAEGGVIFHGSASQLNVAAGSTVTVGKTGTFSELTAKNGTNVNRGTINLADAAKISITDSAISNVDFVTAEGRSTIEITAGAERAVAHEQVLSCVEAGGTGAAPTSTTALLKDCSLKNADVVVSAWDATQAFATENDGNTHGTLYTLNIMSNVELVDMDSFSLTLNGLGNYKDIKVFWDVVTPATQGMMPGLLLSRADEGAPEFVKYTGEPVIIEATSGQVINVWATYTVPEPTTGALSVLALAALAARRRRKH